LPLQKAGPQRDTPTHDTYPNSIGLQHGNNGKMLGQQDFEARR
jgi:hypothetical protein